MPNAFDCLAGSNAGRLYNFKRGWMNSNTEILHDMTAEGPVTSVCNAFGIVLWSTNSQIRAIHFKRNQKICRISAPDSGQKLPAALLESKEVVP